MEKREVNTILLKKIFILVFAFIGFLTTIKLAIIYYDSNFNPYALPSFCSISEFIDCDGVAQTVHSQFFGIPLAYWGMFLYVFVIFLLFAEELKRIKFLRFLRVFKHPLAYISALGFISFAVSIALAGVSVFEIKKVCILCVFTYILNLLIALIATNWYARSKEEYTFGKAFAVIYKSFKVSVKDFIHAIEVKKYLISFLVLAILATGGLAYTTFSYCFTPQVKRYKEFKQYERMQGDSPFKVSGNVLGDKNAKLTVYIYTDYRCPICRTYNVITHRAAQELGGFRVIHKNLPLDSECNKHLAGQFHEGACMMAKYSIAAENQGRFWDLNSEFFEKQPKNEDEVLKLAKSMGFDTIKLRKDANSMATGERLNKEIENAIDLKINGTPTIVINGKVYAGIKPYYELRGILIKAGAFERQ
ncbi:MAG: vitamin K epoxide reductase family protein [Candidatus Gastranaerophilaceae bacterium]